MVFGIIAFLVAVAILHLKGRRVIGAWLLAFLPVLLCGVGVVDISRGAVQLGEGAFESDVKQLAFSVVLLVLSLIAALCPKWPWLFWLVWAVNGAVCGILVYLVFFWKVFS
jgi:predicted DNA repair protein MutK